ncbi:MULTISPECIES: hypothetical protein [unclassified Shinella]|uniref:hypothetical protein n=1 Tax=unclassified Shinella TaxID=2643062 RepID=UPI00225C58E7|nr:hypothetical protein [Shinella sp. YE25]MDC7259453.1 hypothetical protein [Shinella sp. YE25]CAI0341207.1 conserved hypothetical protein [Rhizobiaceae bacterium]CAK7260848.1 DUF4352 domain-containing protein [Shinella sp. WSC3-e]
MTKVTVRRRLARWTISVLVASVGIAIAAYGSRPQPLPEIDPRRPFQTGQWQILPLKAYTSVEPIAGFDPRGKPALVLEVVLTNRTANTSSDYLALFAPVAGIEVNAPPPIVVLLRDSLDNITPALHPSIREAVAFVWLDHRANGPTSFIVNAKTFKSADNLRGLPGWFNNAPIGRMTIDVSNDWGDRASP